MATGRDLAVIFLTTIISTVAVWTTVGLDTIRQNFDGPYYAVVAKSWYNPEVIRTNFSFPLPLEYYPAHLPLYPFLMSWFGKLGYLNGGLIITVLASTAMALTLYFIARRQKWGQPLFISLASLFFWPRMWAVRSVASPETLFILFVVCSLYFFEIRRWWLAGLAGAGAVLTKSPGLLLFPAFIMASKFDKKIWPTLLIPLALLLLFAFYYLQLGDFLAYFHSGDNIHLQALPFRVFDSNQAWVGSFWLEDILWIYLVGGIGVWRAWNKSRVWGWFGLIFYLSILFISHRDVGRYALPLVPVVLYGLAEVLAKKEVRWVLGLAVIPAFFYTINFLTHNTVAISNWAPFFSK